MPIITEFELREKYKQTPFTSFTMLPGCRLTPAAAQFLRERRIEVNEGEKPEHMTHLRGTALVVKNHPLIRFRGKLDTLEALLLTMISEVEGLGLLELGRELRELLDFSRRIMRAEVKEEPLPPLSLNNWEAQEIRERSHYPSRYYDTGHILPRPEDGRVLIQLNYLRTQCREVELAALDAFYNKKGVEREDIITALNRFSSFVYILMIKIKSGSYQDQERGGVDGR